MKFVIKCTGGRDIPIHCYNGAFRIYPINMSQQPVPMSELYLPETRPAEKSRGFEYCVDHNGRLQVDVQPDCMMTLFMLPFPFLCLGCCLSTSNHLVFDDNSQTFSGTTYPGYCCFPGFKTKVLVEYANIGNVGYRQTSMQINDQYQFEPVIITKDRREFAIGPLNGRHELKTNVLAWHKFVFGRNNKSYIEPDYSTLQVPVRF